MVSTHIMTLSLTPLATHAARDANGDWEAVGHAISQSWTSFGSRFGVWIFGALVAFVLLRGLLRAKRYQAAQALTEGDQDALRERVQAAESRTAGEIVVVVVGASDDHPDAAWKGAAAMLFVGTLLLGGFSNTVGSLGFVAVQLGLAGLGFLLAKNLADFRRCFVGEARATEVCEEQAIQELQRLDLTSKEERTAVLLFVSLFEQRVVILADTKAHEAAGQDAWVEADAAVLQALRAGGSPAASLRTALETGIDSVGAVLAKALPGTGDDTNKFDDHVELRPR